MGRPETGVGQHLVTPPSRLCYCPIGQRKRRVFGRKNELISEANRTPDPILSNFRITRIHYLLSVGLANAIGPDAGANFHSWAVWGSRKAGVTIRQEDRDQASRDATLVAGTVGAVVGIGVGWGLSSLFPWSLPWSIAVWTLLGAAVGGFCGFLLVG
ncbi:MAG: hypothetical protein Q8M16_06830 [Pirellulaceae bacterium]|nr:hypothetical protein [Pirellulaceae bacterium]